MITLTLTDLNREPSKVARMAGAEPVVITEHSADTRPSEACRAQHGPLQMARPAMIDARLANCPEPGWK
jgi:hypothetical protein